MNAKNNERPNGAVDQEAFEKVIRDNLSPDGLTTIIAFLRSADFYRPTGPQSARQRAALRECEWLSDTLTEMLGVDEHNRLMDELGL